MCRTRPLVGMLLEGRCERGCRIARRHLLRHGRCQQHERSGQSLAHRGSVAAGSNEVHALVLPTRPGLGPSKGGPNRTLAYMYDPANPVPTMGGYELTIPAGPKDQRPIEGRPDVLVFTSDSLAEPMEVTGQVRARLYRLERRAGLRLFRSALRRLSRTAARLTFARV